MLLVVRTIPLRIQYSDYYSFTLFYPNQIPMRTPKGLESQKETFKYVRDTVPHVCEVCQWPMRNTFWQPTSEAYPFHFAHILWKNMNKKHKYNPANISIVCSCDCHRKLDLACNGKKYVIELLIDNWEHPSYKEICEIE